MTSECRNDCIEPFEFPKKLYNRPGLSSIDYRIGTYADFREAMVRALNQNEVLKNWTHRESDDPGIALLEGAAVLADILAFYQDLYANEAFLSTAKWRESIADLVKLLGYQLSPGVGGKATFAFTFKGDKSVVVPAGFPLKAQLEGIAQPVEFETTEERIAYPELSQFHLYRPATIPTITNGTQAFSIKTETLKENNIELNKGDRLFLVDNTFQANPQRQIVVIKAIKKQFDRTEIYIEGSWQAGSVGQTVYAYKLGRSFRHFGHNSPDSIVTVKNIRTITKKVPFDRIFTFIGLPEYAPVPKLPVTSMPLDTEVEDLSVGSTFLIQLQLSLTTPPDHPSLSQPKLFFERKINRISQTSLTWGAITAGTTLLELNSPIDSQNILYKDIIFYTDIRSIEFLEVIGERFILQGAYQEQNSNTLNQLVYFGQSQPYQKLNQRALAFVKADGTQETLTVTIDETKIDADDSFKLRPLYLPEFSENFSLTDFPLLTEPKVTVYGNLIPANQGKTEREAVLGNGDSRQKFQTFKLPKSPLTYYNLPGETPAEIPELHLYVSDRLWKRVPSFFNRQPDEEVYIVREDANGDSWVQFGDGKTGKQLPSGIKNVVAKYRTGIGAYGQLKPETKVQASGRLDKLDKIHLPGIVSGGDAPESGENAREAAPGKIQSLDRLVSLQDFESETLAIPGVTKALATWELVENIPSLVVTVLMETGRTQEFEQVQKILSDYNRCRGAQRFPIDVREGKRKYVAIAANVAFDSTFRQELVKKAIQAALGVTDEEKGLFALKNRRFGQKEYATRITGMIQNVEGVLWVDVKGFMSLGEANNPIELNQPNAIALNPTLSCHPEQILSLYPAHLQLNPISPP